MTPAERLAKKKPWRRAPRNKVERKRVWRCTLRDRRESLRLSLHDVAKALGMSVGGLHAIDTGSDPQLTTARKIADFFGCTIEELWPERA